MSKRNQTTSISKTLRGSQQAVLQTTKRPVAFSNDTVKQIAMLRKYFFIPPLIHEFLAKLDETVEQLNGPYRSFGSSFRYNLSSIISMAAVPFELVSVSTRSSHHMRFMIAERIRAQNIEANPGESAKSLDNRRESIALKIADEKIESFVRSREGMQRLIQEIHTHLSTARSHGPLKPAGEELLSQGAVLTWGSFEVLARDVFIEVVNEKPVLVMSLLKSKETRARFQLPKDLLSILCESNFNLSSSMGSILARQQDFSDILTIKAVFRIMFPGHSKLIRVFNNRNLFMLCQQRHLLVHQRGIVDQRYLQKTGGDSESRGSKLLVSPAMLEEYVGVVRDVGIELLRSVKGLVNRRKVR